MEYLVPLQTISNEGGQSETTAPDLENRLLHDIIVVQTLKTEEPESKFNAGSILVEITSGEFRGTQVSVQNSLLYLFGHRLHKADICQLFHFGDAGKIKYMIVEYELPEKKRVPREGKTARKLVALNVWIGPTTKEPESIFLNEQFNNWWTNHGRKTKDFYNWIGGLSLPKSSFVLLDSTFSADIIDFLKEDHGERVSGILVKITQKISSETEYSQANPNDSRRPSIGEYAVLMLEDFYIHGLKIGGVDPRLIFRKGSLVKVQATPKTVNLGKFFGLGDEFQTMTVNFVCTLGFIGRRPDNENEKQMSEDLRDFLKSYSLSPRELMDLGPSLKPVSTTADPSMLNILATRAAKCSSDEDPQVQDILQGDDEVYAAKNLIKILIKAVQHHETMDKLQSQKTGDLDVKVPDAKVTIACPDLGKKVIQKSEENVEKKIVAEDQQKAKKNSKRDMKKVLQSYKTAKETAESNVNPLELLRDFIINKKQIKTEQSIWFGEIGFPLDCKVNLKPSWGKKYYTLGALNHLIKMKPESYESYREDAKRKGFSPVQPLDFNNIQDYLLGLKNVIPNIANVSHKQLNPELFPPDVFDRNDENIKNETEESPMTEEHVPSSEKPMRSKVSPGKKITFDLHSRPNLGIFKFLSSVAEKPVDSVLETNSKPALPDDDESKTFEPMIKFVEDESGSNVQQQNGLDCNIIAKESLVNENKSEVERQKAKSIQSPTCLSPSKKTENQDRPKECVSHCDIGSPDGQEQQQRQKNMSVKRPRTRGPSISLDARKINTRNDRTRSPPFMGDSRSPSLLRYARSRSPLDECSVRQESSIERGLKSRTPIVQYHSNSQSPASNPKSPTMCDDSKTRSYADSRSRSLTRGPCDEPEGFRRETRLETPSRQSEYRSRSPSLRYDEWEEERSRSQSRSSFSFKDSSLTSLIKYLIEIGLIKEQKTCQEQQYLDSEFGHTKRSSNDELRWELDLYNHAKYMERLLGRHFYSSGFSEKPRPNVRDKHFSEDERLHDVYSKESYLEYLQRQRWSRSGHSNVYEFKQNPDDQKIFSESGAQRRPDYWGSENLLDKDTQSRDRCDLQDYSKHPNLNINYKNVINPF